MIAEDPELHSLWLQAIETSHRAYLDLTERLTERLAERGEKGTYRRKLARQAARSVLPNATETMIFVTANSRALRHFIELRGSEFAETEIREVALELLRLMQKEAPNLFGDYRDLLRQVKPQPGESLCSVVIVCPDKRVAKFVETVDPVYRDIDREEPPKEEEQFVFWLMNRSRSRAMAAIALDRLEQIDRQKYVFDPEDVAPSRSDNDIQLVILRSLRRLRRLDPQHLGAAGS